MVTSVVKKLRITQFDTCPNICITHLGITQWGWEKLKKFYWANNKTGSDWKEKNC